MFSGNLDMLCEGWGWGSRGGGSQTEHRASINWYIVQMSCFWDDLFEFKGSFYFGIKVRKLKYLIN